MARLKIFDDYRLTTGGQMKSKLLTLLLSSTILISCGKKNGSAPSRIDQSQLNQNQPQGTHTL
jgi:hypothetical protein